MIIPNLQEIINRKDNKRYIAVKYPEFYKYIYSKYDLSNFSEMLYLYYHNLYTQPKCICGNDLKFQSLKKGYSKFCSTKCANNSNEHHIKTKQTCQERYGGIGNASKELLEKSKQTRLDRYGNENYVNIESRIKTNMEKYGSKHYMSTIEFSDKSKHTKKDRYGNENYTNQEKARKTCLKRYGNYTNIDKCKCTNLERYGVEFPFQSEEIQDKIKKGLKEKYGVEYALQHKDLMQKSLNSKIQNFLQNNPDIISIDNSGIEYIYTCKCPHPDTCNKCKEKEFEICNQKYHVRKYAGFELCTKLCPGNTNSNTTLEVFIKDILKLNNIEYKSNIVGIIEGKQELDIYIPSKNIAIECNGVYWHSDKWKELEYHYNKYTECQKRGIQLISIWEDQVLSNPEKIKSIILSKLGVYEKRIYARKCIIKEVSSKECNEFLDKYHLQEKTNSSVRLGLYYKEELISVMTFGKGRKCMNSKIEYELYRYCCKDGIQVIGGASKLFKHFLKEYNPESIESFSSNDISSGNLYKQLGFEKASDSIGYWYVDKEMNRYHRYNFRKQELIKEGFDPSKTEFEIMNERGFYRIYDSGQTKWIFLPKN